VYGAVYQKLGFDRLMGARRVASGRVLRDLVIARIAKPKSKLASAGFLQRDFGIEIDVDQIYRMMDHLNSPMQERMLNMARDAAFGLMNNKIDVLFFDCTTLYFESFEEDNLRQKGFSKDRKIAETQVLLALMVSRAGLPVGYRLYPGAKWEGHTLENAIADVQSDMPVDKVILVADSALFGKQNLVMLNEKKQAYLVAAKLKTLPKALQKSILDKSQYQRLNEDESYFETTYEDQRLIVTYCVHRAKKDAFDRQKAIEKAARLYDDKFTKKVIKGYHAKYLDVVGESTLKIDEEKVKQAALWDGLHGIATNVSADKLTVQEAIAQYRGLWQVEETFRLSKHDLRIRPIFHWKEERIRAHIALCFMALTCIRWLTYTYNLTHPTQPLSAERIRNELAHVQLTTLEDKTDQHRYVIPSPISKDAKQIYKHVAKSWNPIPYKLP
jgi:transposase